MGGKKSMATVNCLVTNILQNMFSRKKETHTDLDRHKVEQITFHFCLNYLFLLMNSYFFFFFTYNIYRESVGSNVFN